MLNPIKTIIFDIDGTLADCTRRRELAVSSGKFNWAIFNDPENILNDKPFHQTIKIFNLLKTMKDTEIYLVSGREEINRDVTERWLAKYSIFGQKGLFMRPEKDYREDTIIKKEIYERKFKNSNIWLVFDDRDSVVKMWRDLDIVCFQVANGNF